MNSRTSEILIEDGDPAKEPKSFRSCLGQFGTGVAVVTARTLEGELAGMTINSFASVSLDPPLVLWSINAGSRSLPVFAAAPGFIVNILGSSQIDVARHFANSGRDRSADIGFLLDNGPAPLLAGALARLECTLETSYAGGDHTILIGRVCRFARYSGKPLLFVQGQFGVYEPHPDFVGDTGSPSGSATPASEGDLVAEIFEARNRLSRRFEKHRRVQGISLAEARVLRRVQEVPGIDRPRLLDATFLGELQLDDAIGELIDRGWLRFDENGGYTLTEEGLRRRQAIKRRWTEFQEGQTRAIATADIEIARSVLAKLIEND